VQFGFNDEQAEIRRGARDLLATRSPLERVRAAAADRAYDEDLWHELVELGWAGLTIDEEHGGVGLGLVELVAVVEQIGYAVAATPLLADVSAALVIEAAGSEAQKARWLPGIASGEHTATIACATAATSPAMPDAGRAAVMIFVEDGLATLATPDAVELEPRDSVDLTRAYSHAKLLAGSGEALPGDVASGLDRAEIALAAELTGLAQRALDMTVAYVRDRTQFGHPIGAFQAVSHRCAEMLALTEAARSATYFAAWTADVEPERLPVAASMAKASAADAARRGASIAIQAHGGIGFTWEADLHWIFKRAYANAAQLGDADEHRRRIARLAADRIRGGAQGVIA
jgi:alkylation response protein AidB-like acyl-CoA dehydrogenase